MKVVVKSSSTTPVMPVAMPVAPAAGLQALVLVFTIATFILFWRTPRKKVMERKNIPPFVHFFLYIEQNTQTLCVSVYYIFMLSTRGGGGEKKDLKRVFHKQNQNKASRLSEFLAYLTFFFNEIANIVSTSKMIKITSQ